MGAGLTPHEQIKELYDAAIEGLRMQIRITDLWTRMPGYVANEVAYFQRDLLTIVRHYPQLHKECVWTRRTSDGSSVCVVCEKKKPIRSS